MTITKETYYEDKTHITNSMLSDFVHYEKWVRILTPETYYAKHIAKTLVFEPNDAMLCGTIVDRYFSEWEHILEKYPVVSKRNWNNPNEITNSMNDKIQWLIKTFKSFKSFQNFLKLPDTYRGNSPKSIITKEIVLLSGRIISIKWKVDFWNDKLKYCVDQKTTANVDTLMWELQFKWIPNIYHRYMRQMTFYNILTEYDQALAIWDEEWRMQFVPIRKDIFDRTKSIILADLDELQNYYDNKWKDLIKDPFLPFPKEDTKEDFNF